MKNYIITLLTFLFSLNTLSCFSQKIVSDKMLDDGTRVTMVKPLIIVGKMYYSYMCRLSALEKDKNIKYVLSIRLNDKTVESGRSLLLKLKNDDIIELKSGKYFEELLASVPKMFHEYENAQFEITESDIKKISEYEVQKIRLENDVNYKDKSFINQKFCKYLLNSMNLLIENSKTPVDIRKGF